jgi:hypothetical protein
MKRLAVLIIILSCLPAVPAVAHEDDPRCKSAKEQTAGAIQKLSAAQKRYNRAQSRRARRRARKAIRSARAGIERGERRERRYCADDGH